MKTTLRNLCLAIATAVCFVPGRSPAAVITSTDPHWSQATYSGMDYNLFISTGTAPSGGHPLVIFLHGLSGGDNVREPITNSSDPNSTASASWLKLGNQADNPHLLAPVSASGWWGSFIDNNTIRDLVLSLIANSSYAIDPNRVYITGLSAGGQGTWQMLYSAPELFAGAAPICGGNPLANTARDVYKFKHVPIWCSHGDNDPTVSYIYSVEITNALRAAGANPILTTVKSTAHNVWDSVYNNNTTLKEWLFAQRRGQPSPPTQVPYVQVNSPSGLPVFTTGTTITVSGIADDTTAAGDKVTSVVAYNYRGGSVTLTGSGTWSGTNANVVRQGGGVNFIHIMATGTSYHGTAGGYTTFSAVVPVYSSKSGADVDGPGVLVSSPNPSGAYFTSSTSVTLSGTVGDALGSVSGMGWSNHRGGSGSISFTAPSWSVSIANLQDGSNELTISGTDSSGNVGKTTFVVIKGGTTSNLPPHAEAGPDQEVFMPDVLRLAGFCADDGFAGTTLTTTWSKDSGPGTVTFTGSTALDGTASFSTSGTYVLKLHVSDGTYSDDDYVTVTVQPQPGAAVANTAVNSGGVAVTASNGVVYAADGTAYYTGGNGGTLSAPFTTMTGNAVPASDEPLYTKYRYNGVSYHIPVTSGTYVAELHFCTDKDRFFDVFVEGNRLPNPVTPLVTAGRKVVYVKRATVAVTDGTFNVAFSTPFNVTMVTGSTNGVYLFNAADRAPAISAIALRMTGSGGGDTTAPSVAITSPTTASTYATTSGTLTTLSGTAGDNVGVSSVTWSNSVGGSGTASGTTTWSVPSIVLQSGTNILTVTAKDAANNTSTDTLTVTYTPPDTTAPSVTITSPTTASTYATSSATLTTLSGTAADNVGVSSVTWSNNVGGSGTAAGTTTWSVSSITLQTGTNVLTVTAKDAANNTSTDVLNVVYTRVNLAPVAVNDSCTLNEEATADVDAVANDYDQDSPAWPQALSLASVGTPAHGSAWSLAGKVHYEPALGYYGSDSVTYAVTDGSSQANGQVNFTVTDTSTAHDLTGAGLSALALGSGTGSSRVLASGNWEVNGQGGVFNGATSDSAYMEQATQTGGFRAVVRMQNLTGGGAQARGGLMVREGTGANARMVYIATTSGTSYVYGSRTTTGGTTVETVSGQVYTYPNAWMLIERIGSTLTLTVSNDGTNFTQIGSVTLPDLSGTLSIGPCVTDGGAGVNARAEMSDYEVIPISSLQGLDVGAVGATGSTSYNTSTQTYTLAGAGANIWGTADAFQFAHKQMSGSGTIVVHVVSRSSTTSKIGVMMRSGTAANAAEASVLVNAGNIAWHRRLTDGASTTNTNYAQASSWWLRLERVVLTSTTSSLTAKRSSDGINWTTIGSSYTFTMSDPIEVGLGVCSQSAGNLSTADFDNLSIP